MKRYLYLLNICLIFKLQPVFALFGYGGKSTEHIAVETELEEKKLKILAQEKDLKNARDIIASRDQKIIALENEVKSEQAVADRFRKSEDEKIAKTAKKEANKKCFKDGHHRANAVADFLNSINIGSFFDYESKYVEPDDSCFVFNSFENVTGWVEPYGFSSKYSSSLKDDYRMHFTLSTFGMAAGARYEFSDNIDLGGAAGYFHSNIHMSKGGSTNSVYFGPYVGYHYWDGFVGFSLFGIKNFYKDGSSWDLDARVESEYGFKLPDDFSIHPFARMDYLNVFEKNNSNKSSFLYTKLGVRGEKRILCHETGFLTANMDAGWINMLPLTAGTLKTTDTCKDSVSLKTETKNQLGVGFEIVGMHMSGLLASIGYEAAIGANSPMQTGRARIEWNW